MKIILKLVLTYACLAISAQAFTEATVKKEEKSHIFLSYCNHFGAGVSYSFQSCMNSNFSTLSQSIGGYFSYCSNFGNEVDYGFTSCVNSGFREAQRQLNNKIYLMDCNNFNRVTLDYSFISCVNSNFNEIQRAID